MRRRWPFRRPQFQQAQGFGFSHCISGVPARRNATSRRSNNRNRVCRHESAKDCGRFRTGAKVQAVVPSRSPICFGRYRQPRRSIGQEKLRAWSLEKAAGQEVEGTSLVVLSLSFAQAVQYALGGFSVLAVIGWVLISSEHHATSGKRKCGNVCPSRSWPLTKPGPRSFLEDVDRDGRELIWEDGASILEECKTPGKAPAWGG